MTIFGLVYLCYLLFIDKIPPVIKLNGDNVYEIEVGNDYKEKGYSVTDNKTKNVVVSIDGNVDTNKLGAYTIKYIAEDKFGNISQVNRTIIVVDKTPPLIEYDSLSFSTYVGSEINLLDNVSATDKGDGDVKVDIIGSYDFSKEGTYNLKYNAKDSSNNESNIDFELIVKKKNTKPSASSPAPSVSFNFEKIYNTSIPASCQVSIRVTNNTNSVKSGSFTVLAYKDGMRDGDSSTSIGFYKHLLPDETIYEYVTIHGLSHYGSSSCAYADYTYRIVNN